MTLDKIFKSIHKILTQLDELIERNDAKVASNDDLIAELEAQREELCEEIVNARILKTKLKELMGDLRNG